MRYDAKTYFLLDNTLYSDYRLITASNVSSWWHVEGKPYCFISTELRDILSDESKFKSFINSTFVPSKGDPIYVGPDCSYAIADVRRNYKIKRDMDTGVCNVVTPIKWTRYYNNIGFSDILIYHKKKLVFISNSKTSLLDLFKCECSGADISDCIIKHDYDWFSAFPLPKVIEAFLDGTLTKPVVLESVLDLSTGNVLTLDVLNLVYEVAKQQWSRDNEKNLVIQYNVLNQHNWRDFKGTVALLNEVTRNIRGSSACGMQRGSQTKPVREIMDCNTVSFCSDDDRKLATRFVCSLLGIDLNETKYVGVSSLIKKLNDAGMRLDTFEMLFYPICKVRPVYV